MNTNLKNKIFGSLVGFTIGDADTIAALTGGILGAKFGYSKIYSGDTKQWVDTLDKGVLVRLKDLSKYIERNRNNDYQNSNCMRYLWC